MKTIILISLILVILITSVNATPPEGYSINEVKVTIVKDIKEYETDKETNYYPYVLQFKKGNFEISTYKGIAEYLSTQYPEMYSDYATDVEITEYYKHFTNNEIQDKYLAEVIDEIKDKTKIPEMKVRVAVSLVQHIPYTRTDGNLYPYELLYHNHGDCEERSILLAALLNKLGYGTALFLFEDDNHMVTGIKCPKQYDYHGTGYCYIETTAPTIMTYTGYSSEYYEPEPKVLVIGDGESFYQISKEHEDGINFRRLMKCDYTGCGYDSGWITYLDTPDYHQLKYLNTEYGLDLNIS